MKFILFVCSLGILKQCEITVKISLIFCLLSVQHIALASATLSKTTQQLLRSGQLFELSLPTYREISSNPYFGTKTLNALQEINTNIELKEQARDIVKYELGLERLAELDEMLEFEQVVKILDTLGIFERLHGLDNTEHESRIREERQSQRLEDVRRHVAYLLRIRKKR